MSVIGAGSTTDNATRDATDLLDAALADLTMAHEAAEPAQGHAPVDDRIERAATSPGLTIRASRTAPRHASRTATRAPSTRAKQMAWEVLLACAAGLAVFLIAGSFTRRSVPSRSTSPPEMARVAGPAAPASKAIEEVAIFDRLAGTNPTLSDADRGIPEPDPATWRVLRLRMTKVGGGLLHIKLARPLSWIDRVGAVPGESISLDLPEMGTVGRAEVLAIDACPPLKPGRGSVVTGTFAHEAGANLVTVRLSGGIEPIGVTDNHPFWSEDRSDFIPVGQLRKGERVRTRTGTAEVVAITKRPVEPDQMVYNLEVHGEHVYQVATAGVLVHNSCSDITFGVGEHLDDFTRSVRVKVGRNVEAFPFVSLTKASDGPWQGIRRAMNNAGDIHFNMKGMTKENFQAWMKRGGHLAEPGFGQPGWTNRELYEILSNPSLKNKTTFYDLIGGLDDWLVKP